MQKAVRSQKNALPKGRFAQFVTIIKMTCAQDKTAAPLLLTALIVPILASILISIFAPLHIFVSIPTVISGIFLGLIFALIVLNVKAKKVTFNQLEGRPGVTGVVLQATLKHSWRTSAEPVAISPRTKEMVFCAVGKPGVALVLESASAATKQLAAAHKRKIQKLIPNVPIYQFTIGQEVTLANIHRRLKKLPKKLTSKEVLAIDTRISSLFYKNLPIPKGIDPTKLKMPKPRAK